jgi:hypothetical protein
MQEQSQSEIVLNLLRAKDSMEKTHDFAANTIKKLQKMNPAANFKVLQLHHEIQNLKESKNEARKSAASGLARSLVVPAKSVYCKKCGAKIMHGTSFCMNCGTKVVKYNL